MFTAQSKAEFAVPQRCEVAVPERKSAEEHRGPTAKQPGIGLPFSSIGLRRGSRVGPLDEKAGGSLSPRGIDRMTVA
jgi:hypothetical protein